MSSKKSIPSSDCLALVWQMSSLGLTVQPSLDNCPTSARHHLPDLGKSIVRARNEKFFLWHENFGFYFANSRTFTFLTKERIFLGPTFPSPWSPGPSSLTALDRQLSCWSQKIKSCPLEKLVPTRFFSFQVTLQKYIFSKPEKWYFPSRIVLTKCVENMSKCNLIFFLSIKIEKHGVKNVETIQDSMFFNWDTQGKLSNFTRTDFPHTKSE